MNLILDKSLVYEPQQPCHVLSIVLVETLKHAVGNSPEYISRQRVLLMPTCTTFYLPLLSRPDLSYNAMYVSTK